jgi:hypothetical protein
MEERMFESQPVFSNPATESLALPTYDEIMAAQEEQEHPEPEMEFPITPGIEDLVVKGLAEIRRRSFSGRHPELGKMIKCQVCGRRHRENERKCEQQFVQLWVDEDMETGEKTIGYATLPPEGMKFTKRMKDGAATFKGKRLKPHGKGYSHPLHKHKHQIGETCD